MRGSLEKFRRFRASRAGNFALLSAVVLPSMVLAAGGAIDFVSHERSRIALQDALDRGTLAAASLNQTTDPTTLIRSYLDAVPELRGAAITVTEDRRLNARTVSASATLARQTTFLKLAGVSTLDVDAASTAKEERPNIELSLVLDISGSMYDNGGMKQLKPAAKTFLETVLKDEVRDVTSVSIVPFAGTVNLGFEAFNILSGYVPSAEERLLGPRADGECRPASTSRYERLHCFSSCFELEAADFAPGMPNWRERGQVAHFSVYNISAVGKKPWWCPVDAAAITYPTNDLAFLKSRIDALDPYDGTGTAYGMKWAELLLNPAMRPTIKALGDDGFAPVPAAFRDRPAAFGTDDTRKFIVLMTDGQIGFQPRPKNKPDGSKTPSVTNNNVSSGNGNSTERYSEKQSASFYKQVCDYARKQEITIFTIAFKVNDAVAATIAECASNKSFAYKVDGLDMSTAFQSIASSMQKIRLVN